MELLNKVEGNEDILKDGFTGALLMCNRTKSNEYMAKRKMLQNNTEMAAEINTIKERLDDLETMKSDVSEIKNLLQQLASGNNK